MDKHLVLQGSLCIETNAPFAAEELADYIEKSTGRRPSMGGDGFCIKVHADAGDDEGYKIVIDDSGILIHGGSLRGAAYGVYDFLEQDMGCRFFAEDCEYVPPMDTIRLKQGAHTSAPAFAFRDVYWQGALDGRFALKCRLNSARAHIEDAWGGRIGFYNYSHSFDALVPPEIYFDAHPEHFSLVNGKRLRDKTQLCLTNPDVLALCIDKVRGWMRDNPHCTVFSVAQNDWYNPCTCDACREIDEREGSCAGTMIHFVNQIADAIATEFPRNYIHTFAYLHTRKPPKTIRPRSNVIVRLCAIESCYAHPMEDCLFAVDDIDVEDTAARRFAPAKRRFAEDLAAWKGCCEHLHVWDYTTNYANYLQPFPNLHVLAPNMRLFQRHGVRGIIAQGNYEKGACSAFGALKIYLLSKLLWDPMADVEAHTSEFLAGYYGKDAVGALMQYIQCMEHAARQGHMCIFDGAEAEYLTDAVLAEGRVLLERALSDAVEPIHKERIERELLSVWYMQLVRLPMDTQGRSAQVDAFAAGAQHLGIERLFERRALAESFQCMKESLYAAGREHVPYAVYRL